jgi:hypothetical protein
MVLVVTAGLLVVIAFTRQAAVAGGDGRAGAAMSTEPQTVEPTTPWVGPAASPGPPAPIVLAVTLPGRATWNLGVAAGKCGSQEMESGNRVDFCVRAVGGRLAVTVTRFPKGSSTASPGRPSSATYGIEPNARISVYEPVRVDLEWVSVNSVPPDAKTPDQP